VGFLLTPKQDKEYLHELERKKAEYFQALKDVDVLKKRLASHDSVWSVISKRHKDSLAIERKNLTLLKNENKRLKNRPVPNWTSAELDSIISTIIHH
jgi:hypothetical protein